MEAEREDYYDQPISLRDASSMLRKRVRPNDKPYTQTTTKLNNRMVDDWAKNVLKPLADTRGTIPSGRVWGSWQLYYEGKGIEKYAKLREQGVLPRVEKEVLDFWIEFFETLSVEEMHDYGVGAVSSGWSIICNETRMHFADEKWEKLYSQSEDPLYWEKEHFKYKDLIDGIPHPFGWNREKFGEITEKVMTVLANQVTPTN